MGKSAWGEVSGVGFRSHFLGDYSFKKVTFPPNFGGSVLGGDMNQYMFSDIYLI